MDLPFLKEPRKIFQLIIPQIQGLIISARRNFFGGGEVRSTRGRPVRAVAAWGVPGRSAPDAGEVFKKFVKKSMKNFQFFQNFQENFAIFFKIFLNFCRKFGKFRNIHLSRVQGAEPPRTLANFWKSE